MLSCAVWQVASVVSGSLQPYGLDCSPPVSSVHGSLQARRLEWATTPPGDLPDPGVKPTSLMSLSLAGGFFTTITTWEAQYRLHL